MGSSSYFRPKHCLSLDVFFLVFQQAAPESSEQALLSPHETPFAALFGERVIGAGGGELPSCWRCSVKIEPVTMLHQLNKTPPMIPLVATQVSSSMSPVIFRTKAIEVPTQVVVALALSVRALLCGCLTAATTGL